MSTDLTTPPSSETTEAPVLLTPAVDVWEGNEDVRLVADLPGATPDDVTVSIDGQVLTVEARANPALSGPVTYRRRFDIGRDLDPEGIHADMADGVLSLRVPRVTPAGPRTIAVQTS